MKPKKYLLAALALMVLVVAVGCAATKLKVGDCITFDGYNYKIANLGDSSGKNPDEAFVYRGNPKLNGGPGSGGGIGSLDDDRYQLVDPSFCPW